MLTWLATQEAVLPDLPYKGVVFTMPSELWPIFKRNRHLLHDLPTLGAVVIQQWIRIKYGVRVFIIVVPHSFGGDLKFNTHLHILISAGGLQESTGRWIDDVGVQKTALMKMWRYAVITHLRNAIKAYVLRSDQSIESIQKVLKGAYERPFWIIQIAHVISKAHFLRYAARYILRPPIASSRLLDVKNGQVTFWEKNTRLGRMVLATRGIVDFVKLLAQHVPQRYKHSIRYFGLLAPRTKARTKSIVFALLGQSMSSIPPRLPWQDAMMRSFGVDPLIDSQGEMMQWIRSERGVLG